MRTESLQKDAFTAVSHCTVEQPVLGQREISVHYCEGSADSRPVICAARAGAARLMQTAMSPSS
jgi:hypothetical protein